MGTKGQATTQSQRPTAKRPYKQLSPPWCTRLPVAAQTMHYSKPDFFPIQCWWSVRVWDSQSPPCEDYIYPVEFPGGNTIQPGLLRSPSHNPDTRYVATHFVLTHNANLPILLPQKSEFLSIEHQNTQQSKEIKDLKDECDALKKRLANMEKRIKPRDPKKESKLRREIKEIKEFIKQAFPPGTALPQKKTIWSSPFFTKKGWSWQYVQNKNNPIPAKSVGLRPP